jgi:hypothetical protein
MPTCENACISATSFFKTSFTIIRETCVKLGRVIKSFLPQSKLTKPMPSQSILAFKILNSQKNRAHKLANKKQVLKIIAPPCVCVCVGVLSAYRADDEDEVAFATPRRLVEDF